MDETVDKVALRREARKRKILENAKNRLERLNGHGHGHSSMNSGGSGDDVQESREFSDPEVEPDLLLLPPRREEMPQMNFPTDYSEIINSFSSTSNKQQQAQNSREKQKCLLILLAAVISYMLTMWRWHNVETIDKHSANGFNIFLPVGLIVAVELLFFRSQQKMNPITNLLVIFSGIRMQKADRYLQFFNTIQSLVANIGLFIFSFCSLAFLLSCIHEDYVTSITIK